MSEKATSRMTARELLVYYQAKLDEEARQAGANGRLACWSAPVAPPEICVAMGIAMVYPETHVTGIGTRKGLLDALGVADRDGYSVDCCSYGRASMDYIKLLKEETATGKAPEALANSPAVRAPLPDLVVMCNNIYNTLFRWYENLATEPNIPCIVIDVPYSHAMPAPGCSKEYIADQSRNVISQLEVVYGRPSDREKFHVVRQQTQRSTAQRNRIASISRFKPSPLNGFDLFNYMALIVCARSRGYVEITLCGSADELEEEYKKGGYASKGAEQNRIIQEGIAVWPYLGHIFESLEDMGIIMTGSAYPNMWDLTYDARDESLHSMTEAYMRTYVNTCLESKVNVLPGITEKGQSDGTLYHLNRSYKLMSFLNVEITELIYEKNGSPHTSFDGDQTDLQNFTPAQYDTRVQTLGEMMKKWSSMADAG